MKKNREMQKLNSEMVCLKAIVKLGGEVRNIELQKETGYDGTEPMMKRCITKGWATLEKKTPTGSKGYQNFYSITEAGKKEYGIWETKQQLPDATREELEAAYRNKITQRMRESDGKAKEARQTALPEQTEAEKKDGMTGLEALFGPNDVEITITDPEEWRRIKRGARVILSFHDHVTMVAPTGSKS